MAGTSKNQFLRFCLFKTLLPKTKNEQNKHMPSNLGMPATWLMSLVFHPVGTPSIILQSFIHGSIPFFDTCQVMVSRFEQGCSSLTDSPTHPPTHARTHSLTHSFPPSLLPSCNPRLGPNTISPTPDAVCPMDRTTPPGMMQWATPGPEPIPDRPALDAVGHTWTGTPYHELRCGSHRGPNRCQRECQIERIGARQNARIDARNNVRIDARQTAR